MSKHVELGRIEPMKVREVWPHEAHDFTQWMLLNADVLAELLGMDLELTAAEHPVGNFSLDLIGRDLTTGDTVIVENQLEPTDHSHLGQLLTYAGGTDPTNIVWCAPKFRDEHRAALDWLNARTDDDTRFFGVEVNVVRIGNSLPAPMFRLVAEPNDWVKQVHAEAASGGLGPKQKAYQDFWAALYERIHAEHPDWTSSTKAPGQNWITLPFGKSTVWFGFNFNKQGLSVELYFGSSDAAMNKSDLARFESIRDQIEADFGGPLEFQALEEKTASRIIIYLLGADITQVEKHAEYRDWFIGTFEKFRPAMFNAQALLAAQEG